VLVKEEVPSVQLGLAGRLGWTTWLKTKPFQRDAEDLVLNP
jgi:type VI secretion system protein ImpH